MSKYEFVRNEYGWKGVVKIYRHVDSDAHVAVSRAFTFDHGDETMIFAFDIKSGTVKSWDDLYAGYGEDHATALRNFESGE